MEYQAHTLFRYGRFEEAEFELSRAADTFEKLGAAVDTEMPRENRLSMVGQMMNWDSAARLARPVQLWLNGESRASRNAATPAFINLQSKSNKSMTHETRLRNYPINST